MTATQALEFRRPKKSSPSIEALVREYRVQLPALIEDRNLSRDIQTTLQFLREAHSKNWFHAAD
jgi:histidine ammonia-lyase